MRGFRRWTAGFTAAAVVVLGLGTAAPAPAQVTAERVITLAGSLQSELGCAGDWDPGCEATSLGASAPYTKTFDVPAGSYEYKVTVNKGWDENYGAGGVLNGPKIPLRIEGQAKLQFSYDQTILLVPVKAVAPAAAEVHRVVQVRPLARLGQDLTKERFYLLMADRFAN